MAFAIARMEKLKGGSVASAGRHVDRTRDTPNADPAKLHENKILIGEDRPVRELVTEKIDWHGGKPRKDSVECVELMLGASPEYFNEGREADNPERVRDFQEKTVEFLQEQYGDRCVKATLHLDEKTPHIHAFVVPVDERGKLNCKSFFGTRAKYREFQTTFAAKMQPLGLERGIEGSRATHMDIQQFYGSINREVRVRVRPERVPDPPRLMMTEASREEYKQQVIRAVAEQFDEPVNILNKQAKLAREEKGKREAAEKRAATAEQRENEWKEKFIVEQKENITFRQQVRVLAEGLLGERYQKSELKMQVERLGQHVQSLSARVKDIPLPEVMQALDYHGELQRDGSTIYRDAQGAVALTISNGKAMESGRVVASNALDLTIHAFVVYEQTNKTPGEALIWLGDTFGKERALAAAVCRTEQNAVSYLQEHERSREAERIRQHELQQPDLTRTCERDPDRGGGRSR
jgi:hypothetical protein